MDFSAFFITDALIFARSETSTSLDRFRENLGRLDRMMVASRPFMEALGRVKNDGQPRVFGYTAHLWLHCMAVRDSLLIAREGGARLWNVPSLAVHARAIQECAIGQFYFCDEKVGDDEREFRNLLWFRHILQKTSELAKLLPDTFDVPPSVAASLAEREKALEKVRALLVACRMFKRIEQTDKGRAKNIATGKDMVYAEKQDAIWERIGFPQEDFQRGWRLLSQSVHATPFAVHGILNFRADNEDSASMVAQPVLLAVWAFRKAVKSALDAAPELEAFAKPILEA